MTTNRTAKIEAAAIRKAANRYWNDNTVTRERHVYDWFMARAEEIDPQEPITTQETPR